MPLISRRVLRRKGERQICNCNCNLTIDEDGKKDIDYFSCVRVTRLRGLPRFDENSERERERKFVTFYFIFCCFYLLPSFLVPYWSLSNRLLFLMLHHWSIIS